MNCPNCNREAIHLQKNEWICPRVTCNNQGIIYSTYGEILQDHDVPSLAEIRRNMHIFDDTTDKKLRLSDGFTLHQFTERHFWEVQGIYKYLCILAKEKFGCDGWRTVSFETVGLWTAISRYSLDIKRTESLATTTSDRKPAA